MADVTAPAGLVPWSEHVAFVRRHRAWIGTLMAIGLALGLAWSLSRPSTFSATASVALQPVPMYVTSSTTDLVPPEVTIDTDAQLLQSPGVMGAVAQVLGIDERTAVDHLSVTASPGTHVLHIRISAGTPRTAADAADAAVAAFVQVRRHTLGALRRNQVRQLRVIIRNQEQDLAGQQAANQDLPSEDQRAAQISQLRTGLRELESARLAPAQVLDPAVVPRHPDYANTEVPLVSGAMTGLLCGWLLGLGRDRATRREHTRTTPRPVHDPFGAVPDATTSTHHEDFHHAV